MITTKSVSEIHSWIQRWRQNNQRVAFVPTMGNLHDGHIELIKQGKQRADRVVASIFVNPLQFSAGEDFSSYPRTLQQDQAKLLENGVDLLFAPTEEVMYPNGKENSTQVYVPRLSEQLCGEGRPGHFLGVTTVVTKLLHIVTPDVALFGEKDFQQLFLIKRMVKDLFIPVQIVTVETVREQDGLALSSRNGYLSDSERALAPQLYQVLSKLKDALLAGAVDFSALEAEGKKALEEAGFRPEYLSIRNVKQLQPAQAGVDTELVILAAAHLGKARLIDNLRVNLQKPG